MSKGSIVRGGSKLLLGFALVVFAAGCYTWDPCADPCDPCAAVDPCDPCAPAAAALGDAPPEARAGEAWCRIWIPPQYETVEEQVLVCPASCERTWVEPVYETQTRQVCVSPATQRRVPVPAVYETVTEQVMVCPARTEWRRVECTPEQLAAGEKQGDCWLLCEVPAQYETRTKQVCVQPETCRTEDVPAVYETVTEQVCVKPGEWVETPVPAQYETRQSQRCLTPGRWEWRRNTACEVPEGCLPPAGAPAGVTEGDAAAMDEMLR